jgi:hypothetical protein
MSWRANRLQRRQGIKPDPLRWRPPRRQDRPPNRPPNNPQPPAPLASQEDNEFDAAIDFLNNVEQQAAPAAEEPVVEEPSAPAVEEPAAPAVEEPVAEEPVVEEPVAEEPVVEEPTAPAVEEPAVEEPTAPVVEEPVAEEPVVEEPTAPVVEEPAAEEPTAPVVEEPVAEEPTAPVVEEPAAQEPTAPAVEEPVVEEPIVQEPVVEEPAVEEPVAEEPAVEEPAVEESTAPAVEEPVAEQPAAPAVEEPVAEQPAVEEPVAEQPVVEEPVAEQPVVEEPAVEEPAVEEPTAPAVEEPVAEEPTAPAVEEPAVEEPAVEEPVAIEEPAAFEEPEVMENTEASVDPALAEQIQLEKTSIVTVGINYFGQSGELNGCVNDSNNFLSYVQSIVGTRAVTTTQLLDSLANTDPLYPTRANMERVLTEAVQEAWEGKCANILFHYSGHGGSIADTGSDEADQKDEALVPVDFNVNGLITDDWIFENVINALPPNVKFFGLIDACHSGTMFDLRYKVEGNPPQNTLINPSSSEMSTAMLISGCKDAQFSYDVWDAQHGAVGAMTTAWLAQMNADRKRSAYEIVEAMRASLTAQGYPQTPQLSLSKPLEHPVQIFALGEFE